MKNYLLTIFLLIPFFGFCFSQEVGSSSKELLFYSDFSTDDDFNNKWIVVDNNNDDKTWVRNVYGHGPDAQPGAAQCFTNGSNQSDDYLVLSNPLTLSAGQYHITFHYKPLAWQYNESMKLLFGTNADPTQLTEVLFEDLSFNHKTWRFSAVNFEVLEDGVYYFAFYVNSPANHGGVFIDNVEVYDGSFSGEPDLSPSAIILPPSACGLSATSEVSCLVTNSGNVTVESFDLKLIVNNEYIETVHFDEQLFAGENRRFSLGEIADFSEELEYQVSIVTVHPLDINADNDTTSASVTHYSPITNDQLPRNHIFTLENRIYADEWVPDAENSWLLQSVGWRHSSGTAPLRSRCFDFEAGKYRIAITFRAGNSMYNESTDFKVLVGPTGTDVSTWQVVREFTNEITDGRTATASFIIEDSDIYSFAIIGTRVNTLWIESFLVSAGFDHDIVLENGKFYSSFKMIPQKQLDAQYDFSASIVNSGSEVANNAKISVLGKNDSTLASSVGEQLQPNQNLSISLKSSLIGFGIGDLAELKIRAEMDEEDEYPDDNIQTVATFTVTDTIYAVDEGLLDMPGVQSGSPLGFGPLFHFMATDTLTSISIGWAPNTSNATEFELSLYYVEYPSGYLSKRFFTVAAKRPSENILVNYAVPPIVLEPGYYYVEINQINNTPLNVAVDWQVGYIYVTSTNPPGYLSDPVPEYGNMMIRPCFGHNAAVVSTDAMVVSVDEPTTTMGLFGVNERVVATIGNNGANPITNLTVYCSVNGGEPMVSQVEYIRPYREGTVEFEVNLSALGDNLVTIYTVLPDDENESNDLLTQNFFNMEPVDPYHMNFEHSQDFAISHFNPNWTTFDGDDTPTVQFVVPFPNMQSKFAFIVYNPEETVPPTTNTHTFPYEGERYAGSMRTTSGQRNDWLISPQLHIGDEFALSLYAKSNSPAQNLEQFNILISTGDNSTESFTKISGTHTVPTEWTYYEVDLSSYANQMVHVAIQCVTVDGLVFMIDDIRIESATSIPANDLSSAIHIYPNPVRDVLTVDMKDILLEEVTVSSVAGMVYNRFTPNTRSGQFRINVDHLPSGIYILTLKSAGQMITRKFIVNK